MITKAVVVLLLFLYSTTSSVALELNDLVPGDVRFKEKIPTSVAGEVVIASFNVRNFGQRSRSIRDIIELVDLVDEADVVAFQEVGLGLFTSAETTPEQQHRLDVLAAAVRAAFGNHWQVIMSDTPSGVGSGRETALLAFRQQINIFQANASFNSYVDLGDRRDMAVWRVELSKDTVEHIKIDIGSVHLTPKDPHRGNEMVRVADWLKSNPERHVIALGDMNWGYQKVTGIKNYLGEAALTKLHDSGKTQQVFAAISYTGKGKKKDFRTNLGIRSKGQFYDQIFLSPTLKLSKGGKLLEDCGWISFTHHDSYFDDVVEKSATRRQFGLKKLKSNDAVDYKSEAVKETIDSAKKATWRSSTEDATWAISDHRPVWVKLKLVNEI